MIHLLFTSLLNKPASPGPPAAGDGPWGLCLWGPDLPLEAGHGPQPPPAQGVTRGRLNKDRCYKEEVAGMRLLVSLREVGAAEVATGGEVAAPRHVVGVAP